jgi:signal transduction histidine kinase
MVKRTVNAHGGIVTVKSTRGKGATFEILLPLRIDPPGGDPGGIALPGGEQ